MRPRSNLNLDVKAPQIQTTAMPTRASSPPWYSYLTFDLFLRILSRSIFHPFIVFIVLLCLRAIHYKYESPAFVTISAYGILVTLIHIFRYFNHRIANGLPRDVDFDDEVVVMTGGKSGLGRLIAEVYGMRGVSVAVLDIGVKEDEDGQDFEGVTYYRCDVGKRDEVEKVKKRIEKDLGDPTILVNCAASTVTPSPISNITPTALSNTLATNITAHFNTIQTFLPAMLSSESGGSIVTISSILAHLSHPHFSAYAATKAAASSLHESLRTELRLSGQTNHVKTLLVETGQMKTPLFAMVETPNRFFSPVLEPVEVAKEIVRAIDAGEGGTIRLPAYAKFIRLYTVMPAGLQRFARWLSGIDNAAIAAPSTDGPSQTRASTSTRLGEPEQPEASFVHVGKEGNLALG